MARGASWRARQGRRGVVAAESGGGLRLGYARGRRRQLGEEGADAWARLVSVTERGAGQSEEERGRDVAVVCGRLGRDGVELGCG